MEILSCNDLCVGYNGHAVAAPISFRVEAGDYLAIVGENGSGKSTLVSTLLGIIPPMSGTIDFPGKARRGIGYLPQNQQVQRDFPALADEVVLSGALCGANASWFASRRHREKAARVMAQLGIEGLAKRQFAQLSGGQRQKVLLARALCAAEELLVLDEPVSGLDPSAAEDMYSTVKQIHDRSGVAILSITHDIPAGLRDATHVLQIGPAPAFMAIERYWEVMADGSAC